jgi:hypothetical protein
VPVAATPETEPTRTLSGSSLAPGVAPGSMVKMGVPAPVGRFTGMRPMR